MIRIFLGILSIGLIALSATFFIQNQKTTQTQIALELAQQHIVLLEQKISTLYTKIGAVSSSTNSLEQSLALQNKELKNTQKNLKEKTTKLTQIDNAYKQSVQQISSLNSNLSNLKNNLTEEKELKQNVIKKWEKVLARMKCTNDKSTSLGSSVFLLSTIATNRHVLEDNNDELLETCTANFTNSDTQVDFSVSTDAIISKDKDMALITTSDISKELNIHQSYNVCTTKPETGDSVLIFGYPQIGFAGEITVTEGIISGYKDGFYSTSAKIARGNSGGAAILLKNDCYLGMPTSVHTGKVESLGRILEITKEILQKY